MVPAFTIDQVKAKLILLSDAEDRILKGVQSFTIGDKTFTRANLSELARQIKYWKNELDILENGKDRHKAIRTRFR